MQSEVINPDSYYWQNKARNFEQCLIDLMGEDKFYEWADRLYPGPNQPTWKERAEQYEAMLQIQQGAADKECERHSWLNNPRHYRTNQHF